jgi:hypothetical protein
MCPKSKRHEVFLPTSVVQRSEIALVGSSRCQIDDIQPRQSRAWKKMNPVRSRARDKHVHRLKNSKQFKARSRKLATSKTIASLEKSVQPRAYNQTTLAHRPT